MFKKLIGLTIISWLLTGCVAGQHLKMDHTPGEAQKQKTGHTVSVNVEDDRSFVKNGDKQEYYIGHYRAGFGNTWDVTTFQKVPLKDQIKTDIIEELKNLGFTTAASDTKLELSIVEWNFDGMQNGKFWYEIKIDVKDKDGNIVASNTVKEKIIIKGTVMTGAKGGFEKEMPGHYDAIIDKIVRNNKVVLEAVSLK